MDWIETIFGFSPDGGSGATEVLIFLAVMAAPAALYLPRLIRRTRGVGRARE